MRLAAHRLAVELPPGWEGRIFRHSEGLPTMHAANFPLPMDDADFGSGAVGALRPGGVFLVLTEYDSALSGRGLFASHGVPFPLGARDFSPRTLQRALPGQAGVQRFFTTAGRAFCLYVVVGLGGDPRGQLRQANQVLSSVLIEAI